MLGTLRIALALVIVTLYTLPLILMQEIAQRTGWWSDRIVPRLWHRLTLKILGIRVKTIGEMAVERPLLIVANHVSWTDILVLGSLAGLHFIAKSEMRHWPVLGTFARLQRSVFVERDRRRASPEQAREIADRLANGDPMVLFAEGTTGDGNSVMPFKSTLFGAAQLALAGGQADCVQVQPVTIAYTRKGGLPLDRRQRSRIAWIGDMDLVPHLKTILTMGALDVEVHLAEPVAFPAGGNRKAITRQAEDTVRTMLVAALRPPVQ